MPFNENHPEYARFNDIYVDESSQTKHRYLLLGAMILPTASVKPFVDSIMEARLPELPQGELAWVKVSRAKLPAYKRVVDVFFNNDAQIPHLDFHSLHVDTSRVDHRRFNMGSREIGFNKEIYQILTKCRRLYRDALFHCYPDKRTTSSSTEELRLILNRGSRKTGDPRDWPFRRIAFRDSAKTPCLQVVDVMLGAIAFKANGHYDVEGASPAKRELCDYILDRAGVRNVLTGTAIAGRFTIWPRQLR